MNLSDKPDQIVSLASLACRTIGIAEEDSIMEPTASITCQKPICNLFNGRTVTIASHGQQHRDFRTGTAERIGILRKSRTHDQGRPN
jgi:hypothetical protein